MSFILNFKDKTLNKIAWNIFYCQSYKILTQLYEILTKLNFKIAIILWQVDIPVRIE